MNPTHLARLAFTCRYTPLPLLAAAGFTPYRVLPVGDAPEQAGTMLHDNLCPHAKRVLDRALADDLPELEGLVAVNSCDAMRRLADAWARARPDDRVVVMDLPTTMGERAVAYLHDELERLRSTLAGWSGRKLDGTAIARAAEPYRPAGNAQPSGAGSPAHGRTACARVLPSSVRQGPARSIKGRPAGSFRVVGRLAPTCNRQECKTNQLGKSFHDRYSTHT